MGSTKDSSKPVDHKKHAPEHEASTPGQSLSEAAQRQPNITSLRQLLSPRIPRLEIAADAMGPIPEADLVILPEAQDAGAVEAPI
ncbi:hypothetical protein MHUMG1_05697 [Metarhizium humberi]|uniref:Uncharacterized protein n=1 Tax=Metarhizium humberi TaxID=2596975 RepID=A0A9P8S6P7_9HYPO|nr:hypothetical protein MHUMG1_05697 [Metarhizium humberi]